jgi:hypothetical protein
VGECARQPIIRPSIGVNQSEVKPEVQLIVRGNYFKESEATRIVVSWDHTVPTEAATTEVKDHTGFLRGQKPRAGQELSVQGARVVTCAPWSDSLTVSTSAVDQVMIWLDNATTTTIGTATVDDNGRFTATIQPGTAPGQHTIAGT